MGWSRQPGQRTVQGTIEQCIQQIFQHEVTLSVSGRTDSGVHAFAQVAAFSSPKNKDVEKIRISLNGLLPEDVAIIEVEAMGLDFEPRFWSRSKCYRYTWFERPSRSPLRRHSVWHVRTPLRVDEMNRAAKLLLGKHDFSSFRARGCQAQSAVRQVKEISVRRIEGGYVYLDVHGHGFLRHMVRIIAGTLYEVGRNKQEAAWVDDVLCARDRTKAGRTAPAKGLALLDIRYGDGLPEWVRASK